ncbi:MAG: hypothetical protein ACR2N3_10700 [Pyrinomonadaceae bacterium]
MNKNILNKYRGAELGGASVKFLIVAVILVVAANAGYNYIPTAYQGENFKQEMQTAVVQGLALPPQAGNPVDATKGRLIRIATDNQLPPAFIDVRQVNNVLTAHVRYSKDVSIVPFGIYNYHYEFDHTATPTGFLLKQ